MRGVLRRSWSHLAGGHIRPHLSDALPAAQDDTVLPGQWDQAPTGLRHGLRVMAVYVT
jgi:hypothetical protein